MERTREEIKVEIEALREMKPRVRQFTLFGDNNHLAIETQMDVLEDCLKGITEDEVFEGYENDRQNILDAALEAWRWANGEWDPLEEYDSPSAGWQELTR